MLATKPGVAALLRTLAQPHGPGVDAAATLLGILGQNIVGLPAAVCQSGEQNESIGWICMQTMKGFYGWGGGFLQVAPRLCLSVVAMGLCRSSTIVKRPRINSRAEWNGEQVGWSSWYACWVGRRRLGIPQLLRPWQG
jgi:hypothetical protein